MWRGVAAVAVCGWLGLGRWNIASATTERLCGGFCFIAKAIAHRRATRTHFVPTAAQGMGRDQAVWLKALANSRLCCG